jgi:hypothetical protein
MEIRWRIDRFRSENGLQIDISSACGETAKRPGSHRNLDRKAGFACRGIQMEDNPYAAPQTYTPVVGVLSGSREDLRSVAKYQKGIILCILVYLLGFIAVVALPEGVGSVLGVGVLIVGIAATVFVFLLAIKVYGTGAGVGLGILTLIPLLGLVILLLINGKATRILKANGIKVGFLGANWKEI